MRLPATARSATPPPRDTTDTDRVGRPRDPAIDSNVLEATLVALADHGYGVTIQGYRPSGRPQYATATAG